MKKAIVFFLLLGALSVNGQVSTDSISRIFKRWEIGNEEDKDFKWDEVVNKYREPNVRIKMVAVSIVKKHRKKDKWKRLSTPRVELLKEVSGYNYEKMSYYVYYLTEDGKTIPDNWFIWGHHSIFLFNVDEWINKELNKNAIFTK